MPYLDGTEGPPYVATPPTFCPMCKGKIVTKWVGVIANSRFHYQARAYPVHACAKCEIGVQVRHLPRRELRATRAAARASLAKVIAAKEAPRAAALAKLARRRA